MLLNVGYFSLKFESLKSYFESLNLYFESLNSYFQSLSWHFQSLNSYLDQAEVVHVSECEIASYPM